MGLQSISPYERFGYAVPYTDAEAAHHLFNASESLSGLAHYYYGDWRLWPLIAKRNGVKDPRRVAPGTVLLIPAKPLELGSFESE